jgi:hypothetical protein
MAQFYGAMVTSGLKPKDLLAMKASTHPEAIVAFTDAVMGCSRMDQVKKSKCKALFLGRIATDPGEWIAGADKVHIRLRPALCMPSQGGNRLGQPAASAW